MSNGNETWMPLYIGDYLGDTMELDGAQHGALLLLLMYYWRNGPLPTDDARLAQIARTDARVWKKTVGPVVRAFFHERDGRLHQKRADKELAKADSISAKRRAAAGSRWGNGTPPPPGNGHANAYPNAPPNADANGMQMHDVCMPDADAKGMLRAPASPSPSQSQKEPSRNPPAVAGGRRADGTNPRAIGTNPRATEDNPRKTGTNPRARPPRNAAGQMAREMDARIAAAAADAADVVEFNTFFQQRKGLANG